MLATSDQLMRGECTLYRLPMNIFDDDNGTHYALANDADQYSL